MTASERNGSLGEIIEASTSSFTAESRILGEPPRFGAFVRVSPAGPAERDPFEDSPPNGAIYGVVMEARTASREPNRRAASYGLSEEDLRIQQPQIWELLTTDFMCLIVAHADDGIRPYLPPRPPRLHAQVEPCSDSEVRGITASFGFLRAIASAEVCSNTDELVAASLREACRAHEGDGDFLVRAGREAARLFPDDYERVSAILRKLG